MTDNFEQAGAAVDAAAAEVKTEVPTIESHVKNFFADIKTDAEATVADIEAAIAYLKSKL